MNSSFGQSLHFSLFGESHGGAIGIVAEGLPSGVAVDLDFLRAQLDRRRPKGKISTARQEADQFQIVSGLFEGRTTGTPLCIVIPNTQQHSGDYGRTKTLLRPSHADYTAYERYSGFQDYRGGGHFSGRITAPLVALGAVVLPMLRAKGIVIGTHIARCAQVEDAPLPQDEESLRRLLPQIAARELPVLDEALGGEMSRAIAAAHADGDSVGGVLETAVVGMPAGVGEPFFHSVESVLSALLYSVPAVKAVEFGLGFGFADLRGSQANDPLRMAGDRVCTVTNNNGGINGGITNGMPLLLRCGVKPTPSIYQEQQTVDYATRQDAALTIAGRHDPCIVHRAAVVVDSVVALGLADLLCMRWGPQWFTQNCDKPEATTWNMD